MTDHQSCSAGSGDEPAWYSIFDQCAQIVRSYHGPIDERARNGLVSCIQHFKGLYAKELSTTSTVDIPAPGRLTPQNTAERVPSSDAALLGAGSFIQEIRSIADDCRDDFNTCPQCGYEDHTAIKHSNLLLLIDSALSSAVAQAVEVWGPTQEDIVAKAIMLDDGCGLTINGQRTLCDDPRAMEKPDRCYCRRSAKAALAALAQPPAAPVETGCTSSDGGGESRPASTEPQASASRRPQGLIGEAGVAPSPSDPQCSAGKESVLLEIIGHLGAILVQTIPSDDQIIINHVRQAHDLARELRRMP